MKPSVKVGVPVANSLGVTLLLPSHAALAVEVPSGLPGQFVQWEGKRTYYCETTGTGRAVGEIPGDYTSADAMITLVPDYRRGDA